VQVDLKDSL